jgi:hypothetical protein
MKKFLPIILLLIACCLTGRLSAQPNTWTQKTSFTNGRKGAAGFSIGAKGYMGTGNLSGTNQNDFWEFDPATNVWTQKANFAGSARILAVGFSIGAKGYMGTGAGSGTYNDFYEYDPVANAWTQKAGFGGSSRAQAVGFSIGSKGYVGTGSLGTTNYSDFWQYNPVTDTWTQKTSFPGSARWGAFGFSMRGKGYIGSGSDNGAFYPNDFYEYDTSANTWTQKATFSGNPRIWSASFSIGPYGYVGTGTTYIGLSTDFWQYDPTANAWTQKAAYGGSARDEAVGFSAASKGYISAGWAGNYNSQLWEYNPELLLAGTVSGSPFCGGTSVTVPFTTNITTYTSTNVFTAQLSDASGSFASPVNIGTLTGTASGSISATIPSTTATGAGYRIRVVSSSPAGNGADNGSNLTITMPVAAAISIAATSTALCAGSLDVFTATGVNGGTSPVYQWQVNGVNSGTNSNTLSYTPMNGDAVACIFTSNATCITTTTAISSAIHIAVNPIVTPAVSIATTTTSVCSGTVINFTATPASGGTTPGYQWMANGSTVGTNSSTLSYAPSNGDTITCTLTSNVPCATTTTAGSNAIIMTVTPTVTPAISTSVTPGNVTCAGTSVTFSASPTNGGSTPAYQWQKNGANVGTNSSTFTSAGLINNDTITCVLTSAATCPSPASVASSGIVMTVNPYLTPAVSVTANPGNTICAGTPVTFTAAPVNGGTSPQYQWTINSVNTGANSPTYTSSGLKNNDTIACTITSSAVCVTTATVAGNKTRMTVYALPNPVISRSGSTLISGIAAVAYQWYLDGLPISGATSSSYTPSQGGGYTVSATDSHGCTGLSAPFAVASAGITNIPAGQEHIELYPNPAHDVVHLKSRTPMDIRVMSVDGKLLITKMQALEIDIRDLASGVYIVEMTSNDKAVRQSARLIK